MRKLFIITGGLSNDFLNFLISLKRPYRTPSEVNGVLGTLTEKDIRNISEEIVQKGYYVFEKSLDDTIISRLSDLAYREECIPCKTGKKIKFGTDSEYPRYDFEGNVLVKDENICKLVSDDTLRALAGTYLKSLPICDLIVMWWSLPSEQKNSEAAQMYHFDMDRFKFLKFFFYLTDVDETTGPHCFVEASHTRLPFRLRRDGRFTDLEIEKYYGTDKVKKFTGKKGTILAVDTRGFHKGEKLKNGNRLLFQIEFSNSLFGMKYPFLKKENINYSYQDVFNRHPITYLSIFK